MHFGRHAVCIAAVKWRKRSPHWHGRHPCIMAGSVDMCVGSLLGCKSGVCVRPASTRQVPARAAFPPPANPENIHPWPSCLPVLHWFPAVPLRSTAIGSCIGKTYSWQHSCCPNLSQLPWGWLTYCGSTPARRCTSATWWADWSPRRRCVSFSTTPWPPRSPTRCGDYHILSFSHLISVAWLSHLYHLYGSRSLFPIGLCRSHSRHALSPLKPSDAANSR